VKQMIILLLILPLLLSACGTAPAEVSVPELLEPVQAQPLTATVRREDLLSASSFPGNVALYAEPVAFNVDGTLKEMLVYPGQQVKAGDVIATLNMDSLQKQLDTLLEQKESAEYTNALTNRNLEIDAEIIQLKIEKLDASHQAALAEDNATLLQLQTALEQLQLANAAAIEALTREVDILQGRLEDPATSQEDAAWLRLELDTLTSRIEQTRQDNAEAESSATARIQELEGRIGEVLQKQTLERKLLELDLEDAQLALRYSRQSQALTSKKRTGQIKLLQDKLANATVTAPIDGTVTWISSGKKVTAQDAVVYITDTDRYYVRTQEFSDYKLVNATELYAIIGDERFDLTYVPLSVDERLYRSLNDIPIYSYYDFAPDAQVPVGMNALVFCVHGFRENVLCIPTSALGHDASGAYVYKMTDGQRVKTYIKTGLSTDLRVEVISGLEEGDVVYVSK